MKNPHKDLLCFHTISGIVKTEMKKNPVITGHKRINLNMDSHESKLHFIVKNK